jgi:rhomboid protease GluP
MTFFASSPNVAANLFAALPVARTEHFSPQLDVEMAFDRALFEATPTVVVTPTLIAINTIVFALMVALGAGFVTPDPAFYLNWGSNYGPMTLGGDWYRLLTATFLHFGFLHLFFNMYVLGSVGGLVERLYGGRWFLLIYLVAGLAGSIVSTGWDPFRNCAGASGAIFGVYGALAAFLLLQRGRIPRAVLKAQAVSTGLFTVYALVSGAMHAGTDNAAHVGGLVCGFLVALPLVRPVPRSVAPRRLLAPAVTIAAVLIAVPVSAAWIQGLHQSDATVLELERVLARFSVDETRTINRYNEAVRLAKERRLTDQQFALVIDREVLPFWAEGASRLLALHPPDAGPDRERYEFYRDIFVNRRDAFLMSRDAVRQGDLEALTAAQALLDKGDKLIEAAGIGQSGK